MQIALWFTPNSRKGSPVFWIFFLYNYHSLGLSRVTDPLGLSPFFCLSGAHRDSIRTSLTLSRGQSSVRVGGFSSSLSHAKKRGKKSPSHPTRHTGAFHSIISCALCKNNPPFHQKGSSLSESVTDPHDGTIMIRWQVGELSDLRPFLSSVSKPISTSCIFNAILRTINAPVSLIFHGVVSH